MFLVGFGLPVFEEKQVLYTGKLQSGKLSQAEWPLAMLFMDSADLYLNFKILFRRHDINHFRLVKNK